MKKAVRNLLAIVVSGAILAGSVLGVPLDTADHSSHSYTVREETHTMSSAKELTKEVPIRDISEEQVFDGLLNNSGSRKNIHSTADKPTFTDDLPKEDESGTTSEVTSDTTVPSTSEATSASEKTTRTTVSTTVRIPEDESKNIEYIKDPDYKSPYYIVVYTGSQSTVVYGKDESGNYTRLIKSFTVSTGRKNSTPTRKGVYKIRAKYRWRTLMGPCYGQYCSSISPDYLFHSVPYDQRTPDTLYNASYNNLGKAVSHGCIRMCVRDVKWIYDNCPIGTQVHVVWESGPKGAGVPKRKSGAKYSGWDPSDQWSKGNPYFADTTTTESEKVETVKTTKSTKASETKTSVTEQSSTQTTTTTAESKKNTTTAESKKNTTTAESKKTTTTTESKKTDPPASDSPEDTVSAVG
jgi:Uncharacterized protein conserved in bacteria